MTYCRKCLNWRGCRCEGGPVTSGGQALVTNTLIVIAIILVVLCIPVLGLL